MLRIALVGAGRMGQAIMREIAAAEDLQLAGVCVRQGRVMQAAEGVISAGLSPDVPLVCSPSEIFGGADIAIDFSLPDANAAVTAAAVNARIPLVCGVTGLDASAMSDMQVASSSIPLLYDRNMSIGIAVMQRLLQQAASFLGKSFAATVSETHHRHKIDAPSGTALKLGEALARSRGQDFQSVYHYDHNGTLRKPVAGDIVFLVRREGENPGEHSVRFGSDSESLELSHKVTSRKVFADGALRAARWLRGRSAGLYSVGDILS